MSLTDPWHDVPLTRQVATTPPLTGGGDLSVDRTLGVDEMVGDAGAGGASGVVPAPAAGDGAAGKALLADGTWGTPAAGAPAAHAPSHKAGGSDELKLHEFGDPTASVQFAQQQALQFRIENRTSDPVSPAVGEIWIRTDL